MVDPRINRLARTLVDYSTGTKEGDAVIVWGYSELAKPLLLEVAREAIKRGAGPVVSRIDFPEIQDALLEAASDELLPRSNEPWVHMVDKLDVSIRILAPTGWAGGTAFDPHRVAKLDMAHGALRTALHRKTRMVVTLFPTEAAAADAGMALGEFEDYVFAAADQDWAKVGADQQKLIDSVLRGAKTISIKAEDTDVTMSVEGRTFINCDGKINLPDAEIMTCPVESSLQGHVAFTYPAIFPPTGGRRVDGIRLWFEDGKVVKATASDGQDHLDAMLDLDAGSRYVGELGIGNNSRLDRWIGNILFDEKIGGTIHLALGLAFPEAGGVNKSALHWDLITDLKRGGEMWVDGTLVQKDGRWVF